MSGFLIYCVLILIIQCVLDFSLFFKAQERSNINKPIFFIQAKRKKVKKIPKVIRSLKPVHEAKPKKFSILFYPLENGKNTVNYGGKEFPQRPPHVWT